VNAVVQANNGEVLRQARQCSLGVAMLADWLVGADVRAGRLVCVLDAYDVNPGAMDVGLHALYQANRRGSHKIRAFVDLLAEHLMASGAAP
jgi:DNA-binding transcriptional LysR family regulator